MLYLGCVGIRRFIIDSFIFANLTGKFFQAIFEIQNAATAAMISDKMTPAAANLNEKLEKLKIMLKTAVDGGSSVYARRVLGVIFHVYVQVGLNLTY